jgi:hypothetical protein
MSFSTSPQQWGGERRRAKGRVTPPRLEGPGWRDSCRMAPSESPPREDGATAEEVRPLPTPYNGNPRARLYCG